VATLIKFAVKARGASHIEKGTPCQDATTAQLGTNETLGLACVADGHGGSKYFRSGDGAILAVQVAEKTLFNFYGTAAREKVAFFDRKIKNDNGNDRLEDSLKKLKGNIIYNWREAVMQHIEQNPFTEAEMEICQSNNIDVDGKPEDMTFIYGTTLLAALVAESFWFAIQIGDGLCVVLENADEKPTVPIEDDERLAFGRTTSLCDNNAIDNFREAYGRSRIAGLTVATDGITDSFDHDKYLQFNSDLYKKFTDNSAEDVEKELGEYLPSLSEQGSRDDVAIAGVFRAKEQRRKAG